MIYSIDKSFERDSKKVPHLILYQLTSVLASIRDAKTIMQIPGIKRLKGCKNCYRIKIHDYRLGLYMEEGSLILSRLLPRKDIYKKFP